MLFPYSDDNPIEKFPLVTISLIVANAAVYLSLVFTHQFEAVTDKYAFYASSPTLLAMFTSTFLHGGPWHLIGNMWFLWIYGDNVEDRLGHVLFLLFYLACAFAGDGLHAMLISGPDAARGSIGASAAISGVLAAYLIFHPWAKINVFYWIFFLWYGVIQIPALFFVGLWFIGQLSAALATHGEANVQVGYWAHVGGFSLGLIGAAALRLSGVVRTPKDVMLGASPSFRRALEAEEPAEALRMHPAPVKDRMREGLKVRKTTVVKDRLRKEQQLLLRAMNQNEPAKVVKYYSLFEQAFPTLALPEHEQWKAAEMLDAAGHDTLALEAYRKLVDHYSLGERWASACLRAGQLYHLHHNYRRARQYLEQLLRKVPESPQAAEARNELKKIDETLAATEASARESGRGPAGTCVILRQTFEPIDVPRVGDVVAAVTGELKIEARARIVREQGVMAEGLPHEQAKRLADRLQAIGVPVLVAGEEQLLVYPEPVCVRNAELDESRAVFRTYDQEYPFEWANLWLINCSRVRLTYSREKVRAAPEMPIRWQGARPLKRPTHSMVSEEKKIRVLDLFLREPFLHLRVIEDRFNYNYLPRERKKESRGANFPLLVKDAIHWSAGAHVGPGVDRLLSEESFTGLTFHNLGHLDRYNFWLVQLCNLRAGGKVSGA